ncbi:peptidoglycan bridge formation glycyltransferase FemA/FemB family protein, partial [Streptomyces erythrochromogenes]|uniref:peptidoglycan bridge formation glycyltransferase FemA/FemB family protein n=1 Tax=Streptomyces erythrochromogenes TaxID=285574 RepID=UPI0036BEA347
MCALLVTPARQDQDHELRVRTLSLPEYQSFLCRTPAASFLQHPSWARVKDLWRSEMVGWHCSGGEIEGAGLVLYRQFPGTRKYFAYLPEGPVADWSDPRIDRWLDPLMRHLRAAGAFAVRIGPSPAYRRWDAATAKAGAGTGRQISDVLATEVDPVGAALADPLRPPRGEAGRGRGAADPPPPPAVP